MTPGHRRCGWAGPGSLILECARGFRRDENGSVTIEFVTLVPFFMALFLFFVDASMLYMTYSDMLVTAGDISRKMSVGELRSAAQAGDYAAQRLNLAGGTYRLDVSFITDTVTISVPLVDAALSGWWMQSVIGSTLYATSTTRKEPLN